MVDDRFQCTKENLQGEKYDWAAAKNSTELWSLHEPDRRLFDRYSGNQVLNMINYFMQYTGQGSLKQATVIETLLMDRLPMDVKSELSVFRWLSENITAKQGLYYGCGQLPLKLFRKKFSKFC